MPPPSSASRRSLAVPVDRVPACAWCGRVLLALLVAVALALPAWLMDRLLVARARAELRPSAELLVDRINGLLAGAEALAAVTAEMVRDEELTRMEVECSLVRLLRSQPSTAVYGVGAFFEPGAIEPDRRWVGPYARRGAPPAYPVEITDDFATPAEDYLRQPWYVAGATSLGGNALCEPYEDVGEAWVTVARGFTGAAGRLRGVVAVDLVLAHLRTLVEQANTDPGIRVAIVSRTGRLVAAPEEAALLAWARTQDREGTVDTILDLSVVDQNFFNDSRGFVPDPALGLILPIGDGTLAVQVEAGAGSIGHHRRWLLPVTLLAALTGAALTLLTATARARARQIQVEITREMERHATQLEELAAQVPGLLFQLDLRRGGNRLRFASGGDQELLAGLAHDPATDHPVSDAALAERLLRHIAPPDRQRVLASLATVRRTGGRWDQVFRLDPAGSGPLRWVAGRAVAVRADGGLRLSGILSDITALKATEADLRASRDAAEVASRAKDEFLATMSHELRTPLNGILGLSSLLLTQPMAPEQHESIDLIHRSGDGLLSLLEDILDLTRIDGGRLALRAVPVDAHRLSRDVVGLLAGQARRKGLELVLAWPTGLAGAVIGDPVRLRQVLACVVANAIKFSDHGIITVSARATPVALELTVADQGIGISPAQAARLFVPFQTGDGSFHRRHGGAGLGLALTKRLVEGMGGQVRVDSPWPGPAGTPPAGPGSAFHLTLPLADPRTLPLDGSRLLRTVLPRPLHLLVVEDNRINATIAAVILEKLGCTVRIAPDGRQGVDTWAAETFDGVLMDLQMPVLDGLEATREIRKREAERGGRRTPILGLTADSRDRAHLEAHQAGMDGLLVKPVTAETLTQAVIRWCCGEPDAERNDPARISPT